MGLMLPINSQYTHLTTNHDESAGPKSENKTKCLMKKRSSYTEIDFFKSDFTLKFLTSMELAMFKHSSIPGISS